MAALFSIVFLAHLILLTSQDAGVMLLQQVSEHAAKIGDKVWRLTEDVAKFDRLKVNYEETLKRVESVNVEELLNKSARNMEEYFGKKIESLKVNQERAERSYKELINQTVEANDVKYIDMVNINGSSIPVSLVYNERFKRKVNLSYSGIQIPANVYNKGPEVLRTIKWSSGLDEVFINNSQNRDPTLKWQYFGSRDAVFRTYPAKVWTNIHYSARRRAWYTQGASSPKNMVIVIDRSGSMVAQTSFIARMAAMNLIDTLSENDYMNVLYFNDNICSLSCNSTLIQATKSNREWFKKKLISSGFVNPSDWKLALTQAFEMLEKSRGADCQKLIMIFTDGTEDKHEEIFEKYNKDKKIRVFTYLVGTPSTPATDLIWMACSNKGYYYKIPTVGAVRDLIEDYVSVLSRPMAVTQKTIYPVWTGVYRDASGLGMMVTGTLPVFSNKEFLGICGVDVTIGELENVIYRPDLGPDGYSFLINNNGHIVRHPNFRSVFGYVKNAGDVDLTQTEFVPENTKDKLLALREKMLSIENGTIYEETLDGFAFTEYNYYLRAFPTKRRYVFTRLRETPFSLAIVSTRFGYEVKDLQPYVVDTNLTVMKNALVFLEKWKYCNLSMPENTTDGELRKLLQDGQCNDTITSNLLLDLNITGHMERIWQPSKSSENISFVFVKTNWGLLRISEPTRAKDVPNGLFARVDKFPTDYVVVYVPHNQGNWTDETDPSLLVYRGVKLNVSNLAIIPAVSGFQVNQSNFMRGYLEEISLENRYHVYLLDENAFIVSSSLDNNKTVTGKFFGSVDWELMAELEKGDYPLYQRFTFRNEQGECVRYSSKTSGSSARSFLYSTIATVFTSWTKKILTCILQLNLYNWFFADAATSTETSQQETNVSCVTHMTTYYANITTWKNFSGNTSFFSCGDCETTRRFFVSSVPRTNLVLVMVEHFEDKAIFQYTPKRNKTNGIPGKHQEIKIEVNDCQSPSNIYRRSPYRCVVSEYEEKGHACGSARTLHVNMCLLILVVLFTADLLIDNGYFNRHFY